MDGIIIILENYLKYRNELPYIKNHYNYIL